MYAPFPQGLFAKRRPNPQPGRRVATMPVTTSNQRVFMRVLSCGRTATSGDGAAFDLQCLPLRRVLVCRSPGCRQAICGRHSRWNARQMAAVVADHRCRRPGASVPVHLGEAVAVIGGVTESALRDAGSLDEEAGVVLVGHPDAAV